MRSAAPPTPISLEQIRIASPCTEPWEGMTGDDRTRHCSKCRLSVHNLSAMSRDESEAFLTRAVGERLCVRLYRRVDGTVLTQDCPVGLARVRAGVRRSVARVAAAFGFVTVSGAMGASLERSGTLPGRLRDWRPIAAVAEWLVPSVPPVPPAVRSTWARGQMLMGAVCLPPPTAPPSQPPSPTAPGARGQ